MANAGSVAPAPSSDSRERLENLEKQYTHRGRNLEFLQLVTKTFVSLGLTDREAICDTLNSMVATNLDARDCSLLLRSVDGVLLEPVASLGSVGRDVLRSAEAQSVWQRSLSVMVPRWVAAEDLALEWPTRPAEFRRGVAVVPIDVRDVPVGLLVVANREFEDGFAEEDLEFLSGVMGVGAMALTHAEAVQAQQALVRDVERQAREAQRQAQEKERALAELDQKLEIIERQRFAIQELSTPVLQLWDNVLAMPIIGVVDTRRSADIMERLLAEISNKQSRFVILDITGVEVVDTKTADHFVKVIRAAELLGTSCILTGIRPAVAQTLVEIGVDLSAIKTLRNLKEGLKECLRSMGRREPAPAAALGQ